MKIGNFDKQAIGSRIEEFAKKVNQTAQKVHQDPLALAEQVRKKGAELLSLLKTNLLKSRSRSINPEFFRAQIRKKVSESLEEALRTPELIDEITNTLIQAAKDDPRYRKMLGIQERAA
ncbi:MAG: hypothetical protein JNK65_05460 [Deltaproteobacteria bacterium]|nr:hypothetical protein [Deltaproteobacteria bacterium]